MTKYKYEIVTIKRLVDLEDTANKLGARGYCLWDVYEDESTFTAIFERVVESGDLNFDEE